MTFALIATILSSFFSALMVIYDRLMITDCYQNKPDQAWFVSSLLGTTLGLLFTAVVWAGVYFFSDSNLFNLLSEIWYPYGLWMLLAGILSIQAMRHYFRTFIPEKNDADINETAISMWMAATPIFVLFVVVLINYSGLNIGIFTNLDQANISWLFILATILATVGIIGFERASSDDEAVFGRKIYFREIGYMLFHFVLYTLIIFSVTQELGKNYENLTLVSLALLPLYWLGFAYGLKLFLKSDFRKSFRENFANIKYFASPILIAEITGALLYFFMFIGLGDLDPTLANLIFAGHIIIVFILNLALKRLYASLLEKGIDTWRLFGFTMTLNSLPKNGTAHLSTEIFFLIVALLGIVIATNIVVVS
ncbi:MAG: hypothetical protein UZ19_OD1000238 [Parcubacteria bacterium OLB19]|nr:MAG: hypothetical protein UZ19_OD1000238 [Parcubacteria bacterium OLB19]